MKIDKQLRAYCVALSRDPLLVQGAGGNVSWKDEKVLWVKASGTSLGDAEQEEIFVPVDLIQLRQALAHKAFSAPPTVIGATDLKPSIETMLHALMPQRVVLHLHPAQILAVLVRENCGEKLHTVLGNEPGWALIDYWKPGSELAAAIMEALERCPTLNLVFLRNHGIVLGGESVTEITVCLQSLMNMFDKLVHCNTLEPTDLLSRAPIEDYSIILDQAIQHLAQPLYYNQLTTNWAICPDHVVFLGPCPYLFQSRQAFINSYETLDHRPLLIFIAGEGVFALPEFSPYQIQQLRCYFEVLRRQPLPVTLRCLHQTQIDELIHWEAELYRVSLQPNRYGSINRETVAPVC